MSPFPSSVKSGVRRLDAGLVLGIGVCGLANPVELEVRRAWLGLLLWLLDELLNVLLKAPQFVGRQLANGLFNLRGHRF